MDVAIEPAGQLRAEEANDGEREKVTGAKPGEEWAVMNERGDAEGYEDAAENYSNAKIDSREGADEMEAEKDDQGTGYGREESTILAKETANGTGGCTEADKNGGETQNEGKSGSKKPRFRLLALAELLHTDAGEHGDVAGNKWQNARRKERDEPSEENSRQRKIVHCEGEPFRTILAQKSGNVCGAPIGYGKSGGVTEKMAPRGEVRRKDGKGRQVVGDDGARALVRR